MIRKTVKFITRKLTIYIPVLDCTHQVRYTRHKNKIKKEYFCNTCKRKKDREDRDNAKIDRFIEEERNGK